MATVADCGLCAPIAGWVGSCMVRSVRTGASGMQVAKIAIDVFVGEK